jgi:transposase
MPARDINRQQTWLFPPTLDELINSDHPARFVASLVDSLEPALWQKMKIELEGNPLGAPSYNARGLLSVWLYGFMTRTRSTRKLEAACRDQIPYLWLTGWQHPDHNTLWRFYKGNRDEIRHLFKLTIKTAVKMDLVDLAMQAIDGTKIPGNATKYRTYDKKGLEKLMERTDKAIGELEKENEESHDPAPVHLPEKLRHQKQLKIEIKAAMEQLQKEEDKKEINLTDSETNLMKSRQGIIAGYNMEAGVSPLKVVESEKTGMIITAMEVVQDPVDYNQLIPMIDQAKENTGKQSDRTLADAGFHNGSNLKACDERQQVVVMPESQEKALKKPYHKDKFIFDSNTDSYLCPCGQTLNYVRQKLTGQTRMRIYRGDSAICLKCQAFGTCTKDKHHGRELQIGEYEAELRRHRVWMKTDEAKKAYKPRKELIEPTFGIIKEQMGIRRFLLRGLNNVRAEGCFVATAFNLRTLFGVWKAWGSEKRRKLFDLLKESGENSLQKTIYTVTFYKNTHWGLSIFTVR